ncbi:MAG: hypothetical protein LBL55_09315 [Propionibacteriaceae bacterium]|nr:hypothetical protein [Propionibacteriaceae bacterium]
MDVLALDDLLVFKPGLDPDQGLAMIADATAQAVGVAPCLADPGRLTPAQTAQFKAVLRQAVLRWAEAGVGAVTTRATMDVAGPFTRQASETVDTSRRGLFWPAELEALSKVCASRRRSAATVDTTPDGWPR